MRKVVAVRDGFYGGNRIRAGQRFQVSDDAVCRQKKPWFVDEADYHPPKVQPTVQEQMEKSKRDSQSFVKAMKVNTEDPPVKDEQPAGKRGRREVL